MGAANSAAEKASRDRVFAVNMAFFSLGVIT